ncbi:MAG: acetyl-CoA acetyltransferase [Hyphomicrobiaceae bacterium]|nr:acetyl-CoA acetyltransferase [Hyphomicrobiaceae bacterium]
MTKAETSPQTAYVAHLEKGELAYQWSPAAGRAVFFPRLVCPFTGSTELEWRVASGLGTVYSTTVVHPVEGKPFNVALIDCDEGFRLMSRVEDVAPEGVTVGMRVAFRVHRSGGDEGPVPVFYPVPAGRVTAASAPVARPMPPRKPAGSSRRGSVAIVGVAESDLGQVADGLSPIDLMAQGVVRALDDCGLKLAEVDGLFCATTQARTSGLALSEYLGIDPPYVGTTIIGGSSFEYHVAQAQAAIEAGLCSVAVVAYGSTQRSVGRKQASVREINPHETPFKPFLPASAYAMAARRHMHQFGTTREQMAAVAVAARQWAQLNPAAWDRKPLTIEGVLAARPISDPFTVRDCCLSTDGGGAIVITAADRARSLKKPPAYVLGCGQSITHASISSMPDLTLTGAKRSGEIAYAMAGLSPKDIDVLALYDAFTINTILFLEDLGFCPKGEGGRFVEGGRIAPGGALAVNTNGGGLSYCHPGMYGLFLLIEATRQVRGECGARQVKGARTALAHGNGGVLSSQATVIVGAAESL